MSNSAHGDLRRRPARCRRRGDRFPRFEQLGFAYALGRRLARTVNGAATQSLYDGLDIAQQLEAQRTTSYLRTLAIDETIGLTNPDGPFFLTADALASIVRITGASGNAVADYTYDTFGAVSATIPAIPNPFQFTGREHDGLAGLYYYRARYYSPVLHRFLSEDPLWLNGGTRVASVYAAHNPVNLRDPEGLILR